MTLSERVVLMATVRCAHSSLVGRLWRPSNFNEDNIKKRSVWNVVNSDGAV